MELSVRIGEYQGIAALYLAGELDTSIKSELATAFNRVGTANDRLIVDLSQVTFIDSAALGLLIELDNRLAARGGMLALASLQPEVRRIFELAGLFRLLKVFDDMDHAVAYLKRDAEAQ